MRSTIAERLAAWKSEAANPHSNFRGIAPQVVQQLETDLFSPPPVQGVDTSLAAAAKIQPHTARIREAIYLWIQRQGARGATAGEVERELALSGSTVRPRLLELQGRAKWAPNLPKRIERLSVQRGGMRVYCAV